MQTGRKGDPGGQAGKGCIQGCIKGCIQGCTKWHTSHLVLNVALQGTTASAAA